MALNSGLAPPSPDPALPHFLSQPLPEIRVRKGSRTEVRSCSQTRWVPCLSPRQPPRSGLICDYLANVSPTWMHTAQEVQNTIPFRCVITGTYGRHRVQFPTQKISHCWESKLHITFCVNLMGNLVWGNFLILRYVNLLLDYNANQWSTAATLPLVRWEAVNISILKNVSTKVKLALGKCLFFENFISQMDWYNF